MTIIFNALNFHPEIVGNGKYTSETVFWLSQKFERVIVITTNPYYPKWVCDSNKYKKESFKNITIFRCPVYIPKRINGFTKVFHYLSFLIFSLPINLYALKYTPKIIITICPTIFSIPNSLLIKFLNKIIYKKKLFTWLHYQDLEIEAAFKLNVIRGKFLRKIILFFERITINQLDLVSTISDGMFNRVKVKLRDKKKIFLFPNFVDTSSFKLKTKSDNPFYEELNLSKEKKIVMFSGTFNEKISYKVLIKTIRILQKREDIFFLLSGEGPKKKIFLESLMGYKNIKVTEFQPIEKLHFWINIADIHLIPQKLSIEDLVLPSKLLPVLASSKPIIGFAKKESALGKILEIAGIRINEEDPSLLADAIIKLVEDKSLGKKLSKNGKKYVTNFHEKEMVLNKVLHKIRNL